MKTLFTTTISFFLVMLSIQSIAGGPSSCDFRSLNITILSPNQNYKVAYSTVTLVGYTFKGAWEGANNYRGFKEVNKQHTCDPTGSFIIQDPITENDTFRLRAETTFKYTYQTTSQTPEWRWKYVTTTTIADSVKFTPGCDPMDYHWTVNIP